MTTADGKIGSWLIWQNSIQPFLYKEDFSKEILSVIAQKNRDVKLEIINIDKDELKPVERIRREVSKCLEMPSGSEQGAMLFSVKAGSTQISCSSVKGRVKMRTEPEDLLSEKRDSSSQK
jgi:hypothetical protein